MSEAKNNHCPIVFQTRDEELLRCLYESDGILARRQVKYLFWRERSWRAMEKRLSKLQQNHYIAWPSDVERKIYPIPEPVIWLGWRGAITLAGRIGLNLQIPDKVNEYNLRKLEKRLREEGFSWVRQPRWSQLHHDLTIVDFKLWLYASLEKASNYSLEEWKNESAFRSDLDFIDYQVKTRDGAVVSKRKGVCPDGFFSIVDLQRKAKGEPSRALFLIEVDMATHDNPSFGSEKACAGVAYIKSKVYFDRFGSNTGRWLVITTGETRMRNLIQQTKDIVVRDGEAFYFTTFQRMRGNNLLFSPIWRTVRSPDMESLFSTSNNQGV